MDLLIDILLDAGKDTLALVPFLLVTYLALETLEHVAGDRVNGTIKRAGEHRRQLQCAFQIQLRNDHARRAVGDQADKRRTQDGKRLVATQELLDRGLAKGLEHGDQNQRHQENKYRDLYSVRDRAADNRQDGRAFV